MSYPYPQDRHLDRKEKGAQPYQDAKEALTRSEAELQTQAEAYGEARRDETDGERRMRLTEEARERLDAIGEDVRERHEEGVEGSA